MTLSTVEVTAPATLKAGYTLDCEADGRMVSVTVPDGGVKEGQIFTGQAIVVHDAYQPPKGAWKNDLCACFDYGLCHPSCCVSFWFSGCVGLAQLMARMNLTWFADPGTPQHSPAETFRAVFIFFLVLWALSDLSVPFPLLSSVLTVITEIVILVLASKTRQFIRRKYEIAAGCCGEILEDVCCILFCNCCSIAQMLKHTADSSDNADCCSPTGLRVDPHIV